MFIYRNLRKLLAQLPKSLKSADLKIHRFFSRHVPFSLSLFTLSFAGRVPRVIRPTWTADAATPLHARLELVARLLIRLGHELGKIVA